MVRPATADQAAQHIAPLLTRLDALVHSLDDDARSVVTAFLADVTATYRETRPSRDDWAPDTPALPVRRRRIADAMRWTAVCRRSGALAA